MAARDDHVSFQPHRAIESETDASDREYRGLVRISILILPRTKDSRDRCRRASSIAPFRVMTTVANAWTSYTPEG